MSERLPILEDLDALAPKTWGDCLRDGWGADGTPCPWVRCGHHLAWARTLSRAGSGVSAEDRVPGAEVPTTRLEALDLDELPHTCALRVAQDERHLEEVGEAIGVTRELVRQVVAKCLSNRSVRDALSAWRGEGREIHRPDLIDGSTTIGLSREEVARAAVRIHPDAARWSAEARARQGCAPDTPTAARAPSGPPARVLVGDERERRIAELKARGRPAQPTTETTPAPQAQQTEEKTMAARERVVVVRGETKTVAGWAERLGVEKTTIYSGASRFGLTIEQEIERRLDESPGSAEPTGRASSSSPKPKRTAPTTATLSPATPASAITLDQLPRVVAVIEALGGLERAERIAEALR